MRPYPPTSAPLLICHPHAGLQSEENDRESDHGVYRRKEVGVLLYVVAFSRSYSPTETYLAFGLAAALLEGLPIIGLVFAISNRVGATSGLTVSAFIAKERPSEDSFL